MLEFSGKNFQCWPSFSIKVDGLTLLTGDSNHGKSAIVRALRGILHNDANEGTVRYGHDELKLDLEVNGHEVKFTRDKGGIEYRVDGKRFTKLNRGLPPGIEKLGFNEIELGTFHFDPIFAGQFDSPFLLADSPQQLNAALGAFASTDKLEIGKKTAASRVALKNQEARALAGEITEAEARRSRLEQLNICMEAVAESLQPMEQDAALLSNQAVYTRATISAKEGLEPLRAVLSRLELPDFQDVENTEILFQNVEQAFGARCALGQARAALAALDNIASGWSQIAVIYRTREQLKAVVEAKQNTARQTTKAVNAVIGHVEQVLVEAQVVKALIAGLSDVTDLRELHAENSRRVTAHAVEHDEAIAAVNAFEATMQAEQMIECPKCHHKFCLTHVCEES